MEFWGEVSVGANQGTWVGCSEARDPGGGGETRLDPRVERMMQPPLRPPIGRLGAAAPRTGRGVRGGTYGAWMPRGWR